MANNSNLNFTECLDTIQKIDKPAREDAGEDNYYCSKGKHSAIISVMDGCGGLGARKYDTFQGHTGAYIASRAVSGALRDWYHDHFQESWKDAGVLADSIDQYIAGAYKVCEPYGAERLRIKGSMVRKFPTTLAMAYAESDGDGILLHVIWAGDSRVYLLDADGLAQLTKDDTDVEDAFENLMDDGAMNNLVAADGNYVLHTKTLHLSGPALVFCATDGCFGYIPSPMEFEYTFLKALLENDSPKTFKRALRKTLSGYAGDDLAMGFLSFFFGSYDNMKAVLSPRLAYLEKNYILPIKEKADMNYSRKLWEAYRPGYERLLRG